MRTLIAVYITVALLALTACGEQPTLYRRGNCQLNSDGTRSCQ